MAAVIVAGVRAPFGKFGGAFKEVPAVALGAHAIRAALERAGVKGSEVDHMIMGQVLQAGAGQITARQAAIEAGIPQKVPAITINKRQACPWTTWTSARSTRPLPRWR
jgi:acetyl-CoA C-acetyltransferase